MKIYTHPTADVSKKAKISSNTKIWHQCHIRENAKIGKNCILGKNVYIDHEVQVGNNVKIQNNSSIYFDAKLEDGVFIGPYVCLTNDKNPRAITRKGKLKTANNWNVGRTVIKKGASIGACSVILPNITIGQFAMIGAGSVVTKDVPDYALVYGNPAKIRGYVCICGTKITNVKEKRNYILLHCSVCNENIAVKQK